MGTKEVFKKNIFDQIISDLYKNYKIKDEIALKAFLLELKPIMEDLADNIRERGLVDINYKEHKTQISYALRYFHVYWYQIYYALNKISELEVSFYEDSERAFKIGLFGAGPAPEIIGITKFIEQHKKHISEHLKGPIVQKFSIDLFDQESEWEFSRKNFLFSNGKKEKLNEMGISINSDIFDFSDFNNFNVLQKNSFDLISFQNCVNEIFDTNSNLEKTKFEKVLQALRPGGFLVFSERSITETVKFLEWFDHNFNDGKNYLLKFNKTSTLSENRPAGPPAFGGKIYDSFIDSPVPEILRKGNFYSFSENPMRKNYFDTYILQRANLSYTLKDLENINFFKIEDHDVNFLPLNPMSPYNDLIGSYEKVEFLRSKRISNMNKNLPFNNGLPNSILENNLIRSWRKEGKSIQEIHEYFQRYETVIRGILKEK